MRRQRVAGLFGIAALLLAPDLAAAKESDTVAVEPSRDGYRAVDSQTGEFVREPTARDDLDQRLPTEYMPPAAAVEGRAPSAAATVLWDSGSFSTCAGCGAESADESAVFDRTRRQRTLGFGHQAVEGHRVADDFTVGDPAGWTVRDIRFFAYQTGSGPESTITSVEVRIWDGPPGAPGSRVHFDGGAGNRMTGSSWTGIYRVAESGEGATNRPIMESVIAVNTFLPQGTYWLDWQAHGRLASGPWAPALGGGNALVSLDGGGSWLPAVDSGSQEQIGFPFVIEGEVGEAFVGAAINLIKTVGKSPSSPLEDVCWSSDSIFVQAGTEVAYCYSVTNTGSQTLSTHDLVDDQLGPLLSSYAYSLVPGGGAFISWDVIIFSTLTNTATWTADGPAIPAPVSDTDTATVVVADAQPLFCGGPTVAFEQGIPTDWTVVNNVPGNPVVWSDLAGCGEAGNYAALHGGNAACASSDLQGGGSGLYDTELRSPSFSLAGLTGATLSFLVNYQNFAGVDRLDVDISIDGGTSWANLISYSGDIGALRVPPGSQQTLDLAGYLGQPTVMLRWRYRDPTGPASSQDWYAQIDNVTLACLREVAHVRRCRAPGLSIPDNSIAGVVDVLDLGAPWGVINDSTGLDVVIKATHTFVGDLRFSIEHVDTGTAATLIDRPGHPASAVGCSGDNINVTIDDGGVGDVETTCSSTPPAIGGVRVGGDPPSTTLLKTAFDLKPFAGPWALKVEDRAAGDVGKLTEWCLETDLLGPTCAQRLANTRIDGELFLVSCGTLDVGPGVIFTSTASATLQATAKGVSFRNGVQIAGALRVNID